MVLVVVLALDLATNPVDRLAWVLAELSLALVLVDLWCLSIALFRRSDRTPLRVPVRTPLVLAGFHLLLWFWTRYLVSFGVFYRLELVDPLSGVYVIRWGIAALLGLLAGLGVVAVFFETRMVQWVLISEQTAAGQREGPAPAGEPDMPAGQEHMYEAQMLLGKLGYEVGEVDGKMDEQTRQALRQFQSSCRLASTGELTVLTMIELRNRWTGGKTGLQEMPVEITGTSHLFQRVGNWIARWKDR